MEMLEHISRVLPVLLVLLLSCAAAPSGFCSDLGFADDWASIGIDLGPLADLALKEDVQLCGAARLRVADSFALKLPFTAVLGKGRTLFDAGLMLVYYPLDIGPFVSLSLMRFGFEGGFKTLDEDLVTLDEVAVGWTWNFAPSWHAEAALAFRDPSGTHKEIYEGIRESYPGYKPFRLRLFIGWNFLRRK